MQRRALLHNLFSSIVAVPMLGGSEAKTIESSYSFGRRDFRTTEVLVQPDDEYYIGRAIRSASNVPKYPFGALLVDRKKGEIVADGWNRSVQNPTWHGEMDAINKCSASHAKIDWTGLTLYTTAEPCAMCQGAVAWTGIGRVVFGSSIPFLKSLNWWAIDIRAEELARRAPFRECTVVGGVMEEECNKLFRRALTVK
jgi:tRNA(adenine34) deaminase